MKFETRWHHTDVLVVGAGPAGLSAARAARECGADVTLVDQESQPADLFVSTNRTSMGGGAA